MKQTWQSIIGDVSAVKKRTIAHSTFEKWKHDFDLESKTVTWLDCESTEEGGAKVITKLKCIQFVISFAPAYCTSATLAISG